MDATVRRCALRRAAALGVSAISCAIACADVMLVAGTDSGVPAQVQAFDAGGSPVLSLTPFGGFTGGVRVATADLNGDGHRDVLAGAGPGAPGGNVQAYDGVSGALLRNFFAYDLGFTGGVFVATGDVNGDGRADIVTGTDAGANGHVKVFDGISGQEIQSFLPYGASFSDGVRVASADVNNDGFDDIVTGAGGSSGGHVKVFDGNTGQELRSFFAYDGFVGGVHVASSDVNRDGRADIITGADEGASGGHVKVFDGATGQLTGSFLTFTGSTSGVRVAAGDVNGDGFADLSAALGNPSNGQISLLTPDGRPDDALLPFGPSYTGGIFVGMAAIPEPATVALLGVAALLARARPSVARDRRLLRR